MSQIITIDDLTGYMTGQTLDADLAQTVVDATNAYVETRTGRCFGETKQVTERYNWSNQVWLRHADIISLDVLTVGWPGQTNSTLDPTGYFLNALGRVTLLSFAYPAMETGSFLYNDYLSIKYTYGYTTLGLDDEENPIVPDDLKLAALGIAGGAYAWAANGNRAVSSLAIGSYRIEYAQKRGTPGTSPADEAAVDGNISWTIIDSYRLRRQ